LKRSPVDRNVAAIRQRAKPRLDFVPPSRRRRGFRKVGVAPTAQIRTVSLAVNGKDADGEEIVRWHRLVDFADYLADCHKGDRLKVTGYFRDRTYTKDGEQKSIRELVLTAAEIQPKKDKAQAA
jgi:single-stranded DNA-binding protein